MNSPAPSPSVQISSAPTLSNTRTGWAATVRRATVSELIKLRTLRSNMWLLAAAVLFLLLLGPIQTVGQVVAPAEQRVETAAGAISLALAGLSTSTLLLGILGVLLVTGEYAPRAIRTTFMLIPRRGHIILGKLTSLTLVTGVTALPAVAIAVTASFAIVNRVGLDVGWGSPQVLRIVAGSVWVMVGWGIFGQLAGWVTRSKLGGAALLFGVMLVLTPVLGLVPGTVGDVLIALTPASAAGAMVNTHHVGALDAPAAGFILWTAYLLGGIALAAAVVRRRDA
jgi:ABC-2 type transport system permease protein